MVLRWPIEIDGLPFLKAWWIFPWQTVSHNQMVNGMIEALSLSHCCREGFLVIFAETKKPVPRRRWFLGLLELAALTPSGND